MQFAVEKCSCGNNGTFAVIKMPQICFHTADRISVNKERDRNILFDGQIFLLFQIVFHCCLIDHFIALGSGTAYGRAFGAVQHFKLDGGGIRNERHRSAESVDLPDNMPFGNAADTGIAAHLGDMIRIDGKHKGIRPQSCGGKGGFTCGMSAAYNDDIIIFFHAEPEINSSLLFRRNFSGYKKRKIPT